MINKRSSEIPKSSQIGRDETLDGNSQEALELSETVQSREGQARPKVAATEFPVTAWDRYEFERLLGKGGMGAVYQARDRKLGRTVALKFIRGDDAGMSARFMQEARAQSRLSHHNICQVYETGEVEGKWYIAMEYIDGVPLDKASPSLALQDKIQVIRDVARALHSAHDLGIIHRDIKPSNIMIERAQEVDGTVRTRPVLMDFGLAREASDGKGLTESGAVMGTEQAFLFDRRCMVLRQRRLGIGKRGRQVGSGRERKRAVWRERTATPHRNESQSGDPFSLGRAPSTRELPQRRS